MGDLRKDFSAREFECPCAKCSRNGVVPTDTVLDALQGVRDALGEPLRITSGVRCVAHNAAVGGAASSRHLPAYRDAVDIQALDSTFRYLLIMALYTHGAKAIRVYPRHVHADWRPGPPLFILSE